MEKGLASGLDLVAVSSALVTHPDLFSQEKLPLTLSASGVDSIDLPQTMFEAMKRIGAFNFQFTE